MTPLAALGDMPPAISVPLAAFLGLIAGSFIATLVLRWGAKTSILGRSRCDGCGRVLGWIDLVPLLGWLRARGRCQGCGTAIDPLHLRVEIGAAAIGAAALLLWPGAGGWGLALFGWLLLPLGLLDARHFWLPDVLVAVLAGAGLVLAAPLLGTPLLDGLIGALAAGGTLAVLRALFLAFRGREGMGEGDPKFATAIGVWTGWEALPMLFLLASAGGILWALATQQKDAPIADRHVPFGAFLAAAAWCAVPLWLWISA